MALIEEAREINERLEAFCVLNAADPVGKDNSEAAAALMEYEQITFIPTSIVRRKIFSNAAAMGRGIREMQPRDRKAEAELAETCRMLSVYRRDIGKDAYGHRKETA
jgi:cellulose biosynthesis protein BcsQ